MIYEILLSLLTMQPVAENNTAEKSVAETEIRRQIAWPVGCWNCRSWGGMRLLEDGYAIDTDPEGFLNDWGVWQHFGGPNQVIVVWMESSRVEIIEKNNDKYYHQMSYSFGIGSEIEEVKKVGK